MFGALRSHKFYVPLITVTVSVGLFLVYYFFYVARERNEANERAFDGEISGIQVHDCLGISDRNGKVALELVPDTVRGISLRATFRQENPSGKECSISAILDYGAGLRARFQNVTQDYFDDILIATSSGEVLFQKNAGGFRITDFNALFSAADS